MTFKEIITNRYSCRSYSSQTVEKEKLNRIMEAAVLAPTAVNFQPWKMIVLTDPELLKEVRGCYHREWFNSAPVVVIALGDHSKGWKRPFDGKDHTEIDVTIAVDHMILAATEEGLGTCWICHFDPDKCSTLLNLPDHLEPIIMVAMGYPATDSRPEKRRKPMEELVIWNKL